MRRSGSILSIAFAAAPILYAIVFTEGDPDVSANLLITLMSAPIAAGLLFIALAVRIHRVLDALPAAFFIVVYFLGVVPISGGYPYSPVPEHALPILILVTQATLSLRYRKWVEILCFVLLGIAVLLVVVPLIFPQALATPAPAWLSLPAPAKTPWWISDSAALLFLISAVFLALLPRDNPRTFRLEYILVLVPAFLFFEDLASRTGSTDGLFRAVCAASYVLILITGLGRIYLLNAFVDELTGLQNRRAFDEKIKRLGGSYALAIADIDHFKGFNDTYGHAEGDNALRWTAKHLFEFFGGRAYRYGGEEFCVVFPPKRADEAYQRLEAFRKALEASDFSIRRSIRTKKNKKAKGQRGTSAKHKTVRLTVSIGVAKRGNRRIPPTSLLNAADAALYEAKARGRNQTRSAPRQPGIARIL